MLSLTLPANIQSMEVDELKEKHHHHHHPDHLPPLCHPYNKTQSPSPTHFTNIELANNNQDWFSSRIIIPPQNNHNVFSPNTATFDEARDHEKRMKRVIANRESARRSRMRRKKLIEGLQLQLHQAQTLNHQLSEKVILLLETNHQILQENAQLKEKVSSLQLLLNDLISPLKGFDQANANRFRPDTSLLSIHST